VLVVSFLFHVPVVVTLFHEPAVKLQQMIVVDFIDEVSG